MTEAQLLEITQDLLETNGPKAAYAYIAKNEREVRAENRSRIYNILFCLASEAGQLSDAMHSLREAVLERGYWYRPDVFDDADLAALRGISLFDECKRVSLEHFSEALRQAKPVFTYRQKRAKGIAVALHADGQNSAAARAVWSFLESPAMQLECLQSEEPDSYELYRWSENGNGDRQLAAALDFPAWRTFQPRALVGCGSGCDVVLRAAGHGVPCEEIVFVNPRLPSLQGADTAALPGALANLGARLTLIAGERDRVAAAQARALADKARALGVTVAADWIEEGDRTPPADLEARVRALCPALFPPQKRRSAR